MKHRQIYTTISCVIALVGLFSVANAQSEKLDDPTPLTSNEISGVIDKNTKDDTYRYYSFWANPGEVKVTITVERNLNIDNNFSLTSAEFVLYDSNSEVIAKKSASTYSGSGSQPAVATAQVQITKRQPLVLGIKLPGGTYFGGIGKYKVRLDGAVEFSVKGANLDEVLRRSLEGNENKEGGCLPKQGTLIIKMKDGSKKIIDLNEAETITIVP